MAITEQAITATLLKINGTTVPGIKSYKVGYNHLWKDADRNMSGSVRASLIGIFPKNGISLVSNIFFFVSIVDSFSRADISLK